MSVRTWRDYESAPVKRGSETKFSLVCSRVNSRLNLLFRNLLDNRAGTGDRTSFAGAYDVVVGVCDPVGGRNYKEV